MQYILTPGSIAQLLRLTPAKFTLLDGSRLHHFDANLYLAIGCLKACGGVQNLDDTAEQLRKTSGWPMHAAKNLASILCFEKHM
eukprot:2176888-Amphidinium_carterae.3